MNSQNTQNSQHTQDQTQIRLRYAPSPTGYLHVGGARTALYNYLFARQNKGCFILRVEDTDQQRSTEEALALQIQDLKWLGLNWDEGPSLNNNKLDEVGNFGPYKQSQRLAIYKAKAEELLSKKHAYYCFCQDENLERKKQEAMTAGRPPHYDRTCLNLKPEEVNKRRQNGEKACVRFLVPNTVSYHFHDLVRGEVQFPAEMVGDFVILRSDGMPVYNFCCVVDDALMKITHVLRAEEHLSNTLRQMMIYQAIGEPYPKFAHLSIVLGPDRQKLSKRHGATSCNEYRRLGFLPEALLNFVALLGWSSANGQELLNMNEMIENFALNRLHAAAAVFDEAKLRWVNAQHLRTLSHDDLWNRLEPFFEEAQLVFPDDKIWRDRALNVFKTSMVTLKDAVQLMQPLCDNVFKLSSEGLEVLKWPTSQNLLVQWKSCLESHPNDYMSENDFLAIQEKLQTLSNLKGKLLFQPLRVSIIGHPQGSELKVLVSLLHKKSLLKRVEFCQNTIHKVNERK